MRVHDEMQKFRTQLVQGPLLDEDLNSAEAAIVLVIVFLSRETVSRRNIESSERRKCKEE